MFQSFTRGGFSRIVVLLSCAWAVPALAQNGPMTEAQAMAAESQYQQYCALCHGAERDQ